MRQASSLTSLPSSHSSPGSTFPLPQFAHSPAGGAGQFGHLRQVVQILRHQTADGLRIDVTALHVQSRLFQAGQQPQKDGLAVGVTLS